MYGFAYCFGDGDLAVTIGYLGAVLTFRGQSSGHEHRVKRLVHFPSNALSQDHNVSGEGAHILTIESKSVRANPIRTSNVPMTSSLEGERVMLPPHFEGEVQHAEAGTSAR